MSIQDIRFLPLFFSQKFSLFGLFVKYLNCPVEIHWRIVLGVSQPSVCFDRCVLMSLALVTLVSTNHNLNAAVGRTVSLWTQNENNWTIRIVVNILQTLTKQIENIPHNWGWNTNTEVRNVLFHRCFSGGHHVPGRRIQKWFSGFVSLKTPTVGFFKLHKWTN